MKKEDEYSNEEKRKYLRKEIIDKGYDVNEFQSFLYYKKGKEGMVIDNWTMDELKAIIKEYMFNNENNQDINLNDFEDINKHKGNSDLKNEKFKETKNEKNDNKEISLKNLPLTDKKKEYKKKITIIDFNKCDSIQVKILPFNVDSSNLLSKFKIKNLSNMIFYIDIKQFNLRIKRIYSDYEWLYGILTNNYKYKLPYEFPKISIFYFSLLKGDFNEASISQYLEKIMNFLLNTPNIKNKKIIFDFVTIEKDNDFQEIKKIYEKINYPNPLLENKINNEKEKEEEISSIFEETTILNEEDYIHEINDDIEINSSDIKQKIINFLNQEDYIGLKNFCYKCSKNDANKEIMITNLCSLYKEGKNNIYALIDKYEILRILAIFNEKNFDYYYKEIIHIIKRINNTTNLSIDEYFTRINKFSEIIQEQTFHVNFLEKLAEENLRNIKTFIDLYYKGQEKNAIEPFLKEKYVEIINDYKNVVVNKYDIKEKKILDKLKSLKDNNDDIEELNIFIKSLNGHEQLYYDLLVQSILEAPDSDSDKKAWIIPIFKVIKDALGSIIGTAIASFTGSKILTALSATAGTLIVINDITDIYLKKNYFSKNGEFRKLYHINQRNSYDKRWNIIKRNIKEKIRKFVQPIKKGYYYLVDSKLLNITEQAKLGFEKVEEDINIKDESQVFKANIIANFQKVLKDKLELKHYQHLIKLKKKFRKKAITKSYEKIKEESDKKENEIKIETNKKIEKKQIEYPEFKDNSYIQKKINSVYSFASNITDVFKIVISLGGTNKKKSDNELMEEIINNFRYKNYLKELEFIEKDNKIKLFENLNNEVKKMCDITKKDKIIFSKIKEKYNEEKEKINNLSQNNDLNNIKNEEKLLDINLNNANDNDSENEELNEEIRINSSNYDYDYYENYEREELMIKYNSLY